MALEPEYKNIMTESIPAKESEPVMITVPMDKYESLIGFKIRLDMMKDITLKVATKSITRETIAAVLGFELENEVEE